MSKAEIWADLNVRGKEPCEKERLARSVMKVEEKCGQEVRRMLGMRSMGDVLSG